MIEIAGNLDHAPAGAAEPGIDAEDANRAAHLALVIDPPSPAEKHLACDRPEPHCRDQHIVPRRCRGG